MVPLVKHPEMASRTHVLVLRAFLEPTVKISTHVLITLVLMAQHVTLTEIITLFVYAQAHIQEHIVKYVRYNFQFT